MFKCVYVLKVCGILSRERIRLNAFFTNFHNIIENKEYGKSFDIFYHLKII